MIVEAVVSHNGVPDHMERGREGLDLGMEYVAEAMVESLERTSPKDTRRMSESWYSEQVGDKDYRFDNLTDYWKHVWKGTGVYGPTGEPIKPKTAEALKFEWKGMTTVWKGDLETDEEKASFIAWARARGMVPFLVWPRGIKGRPYVEEAMEITRERAEGCLERGLMEKRAVV